MKTTVILISLMAFLIGCSNTAEAGHSTGNSTCHDDKLHYTNMIANGKRSDAPLYWQSIEKFNEAVAVLDSDPAACEVLMEEVLRMIRKTGGEYPTE